MIRKDVYLNEYQIKTLEERKELLFAEHIRRAIDDYIQKLTPERAVSSVSQKKWAEGYKLKY